MAVPTYYSMTSYLWVLCSVLVLIVIFFLSSSLSTFTVPTSSQLFWRSWNAPLSTYRLLKAPVGDSNFLLLKWHGINPFKLLPTICTLLDGFSPITDPLWSISAYLLLFVPVTVLCFILPHLLIWTCSSTFITSFICFFIYLCLGVSFSTFLFKFLYCFFL